MLTPVVHTALQRTSAERIAYSLNFQHSSGENAQKQHVHKAADDGKINQKFGHNDKELDMDCILSGDRLRDGVKCQLQHYLQAYIGIWVNKDTSSEYHLGAMHVNKSCDSA